MKNDRTLQLKFNNVALNSFWISVENEYPVLAENALKILLQFSTSWLCEHGFSTLMNVKTKKRQTVTEDTLEDDMRVCLSNVPPRVLEL